MKKFCHLSSVICHSSFGFTLIEMLVTIAVIAIVSGVAIVGIDPAKRIRDAQDSRARQDVRGVASAVEACLSYVTPPPGNVANAFTDCNSPAGLTTNAPGAPFSRTIPSLVTISGSGPICVKETGVSTWYYSTATGQVSNTAC